MLSAFNMKLRVVSYNVLSSHLASVSQYPTLVPEHLDAAKRLPVVLNKLNKEMSDHENTVLCLQEVSYDWAGALHTFFANKGYHLVTGNYGKPFNGYMGVVLAWPTKSFEVLDVNICRLSDVREDGWPPRESPSSALSVLVSKMQSAFDKAMTTIGWKKDDDVDHWDISERRFNVLLSATLRERESGKPFCVGTYHMPCAFYAPKVMTIHADLVAKTIQTYASKQGAPYILAGDFNIKPVDSVYRMLTTEDAMDTTDPAYPSPKNGFEWKQSCKPMASAYGSSENGEPDFTNFATNRDDVHFVDTLDYIFLSPEWQVQELLPLPHRSESKGPFPNLDAGEPSDHILIATTLTLN